MNTERAKNLTIIFLLFLNLMLISLLIIATPTFRISRTREAAILTLLEQNNITLNAELIRRYRPMRPIAVSPSEHCNDLIAQTLLGDLYDVQIFEEFDRIVYTRNNEHTGEVTDHLEIQGSYFYIIYGNNWTGSISPVMNKEDAIALSDEFLESINHLFPDFLFYAITEDEHWGDFIVEYRRLYRNQIIYSDFIRFRIDEAGISKIDCHHVNVQGFEQTLTEIRPVDEALYALILELQNMGAFVFGDITINGIDIVYYQSTAGFFDSSATTAEPCYRFYVSIGDLPGITIIIDAATATVISG